MEAVTGHYVGRATKDLSGGFLYVHQLKHAQLAFPIVEKKVDVGFLTRFIARRGSEHVKMFDPKTLQFGGVGLKTTYCFMTIHDSNIAWTRMT